MFNGLTGAFVELDADEEQGIRALLAAPNHARRDHPLHAELVDGDAPHDVVGLAVEVLADAPDGHGVEVCAQMGPLRRSRGVAHVGLQFQLRALLRASARRRDDAPD